MFESFQNTCFKERHNGGFWIKGKIDTKFINMPADKNTFSVNNTGTTLTFEISLQSIVKISDCEQWRCSSAFTMNF